MTIGSRIAKCRKEKNLSQTYVAEMLDVTRQAVSKWETDVNVPDTENLIKLSKLLSVSVEYLACGNSGVGLGGEERVDVLADEESAFANFKNEQIKAKKEEVPRGEVSIISRILGYMIASVGFVISFTSWASGILLFPLLIIGLGVMIFGIYLALRTKRFWD